MKRRKKEKEDERPIFDSIRKPTAPPAKIMGTPRLEEKLHPAQRKTKHKPKVDTE